MDTTINLNFIYFIQNILEKVNQYVIFQTQYVLDVQNSSFCNKIKSIINLIEDNFFIIKKYYYLKINIEKNIYTKFNYLSKNRITFSKNNINNLKETYKVKQIEDKYILNYIRFLIDPTNFINLYNKILNENNYENIYLILKDIYLTQKNLIKSLQNSINLSNKIIELI